MESLAVLFKNAAIHSMVADHPWVWPIMEMVHFVGMALLFGTVVLLDLRILGLAKRLPVAPLNRLIPYGIFGFILNLATGYLFIVGTPGGNPLDYLDNIALQLKMVFVVLAGLNVMAFYLTGVSRAADALGPGDDAPMSAKVIAATSLFLWLGVIYFGRMIMYVDAFYTREYYPF